MHTFIIYIISVVYAYTSYNGILKDTYLYMAVRVCFLLNFVFERCSRSSSILDSVCVVVWWDR